MKRLLIQHFFSVSLRKYLLIHETKNRPSRHRAGTSVDLFNTTAERARESLLPPPGSTDSRSARTSPAPFLSGTDHERVARRTPQYKARKLRTHACREEHCTCGMPVLIGRSSILSVLLVGRGKGIFPCPFTVESLEYSEHQKEIRKLIVPGNSTLTSPHEYQPHSCSRRSIAKN
jgi:hypothetical protein